MDNFDLFGNLLYYFVEVFNLLYIPIGVVVKVVDEPALHVQLWVFNRK